MESLESASWSLITQQRGRLQTSASAAHGRVRESSANLARLDQAIADAHARAAMEQKPTPTWSWQFKQKVPAVTGDADAGRFPVEADHVHGPEGRADQ